MTVTHTRTTRNSQRSVLSAQPRSSLTPVRRSTTFGTSTHTSSVFRPIGSGAESISTNQNKELQTPHGISDASKNLEANVSREEDHAPSPLEYINNTQDLPNDPPDPGDGDNGDEDPKDPHNKDGILLSNRNERFLEVMSSLAAGISSLCQPPSAPKPEKVKVQEPDTFDSSDPCKLRDFLVSCNLHFRDHSHVFSSDENPFHSFISQGSCYQLVWAQSHEPNQQHTLDVRFSHIH